MSAAMMLPTVVPATYLAAAVGRSATLFVLGYSAVWAAAGLLAFGAARALDGAARWLADCGRPARRGLPVDAAEGRVPPPLPQSDGHAHQTPLPARGHRARRALPRVLLGADAGPHRARHRQHAVDGGPGCGRSRREGRASGSSALRPWSRPGSRVRRCGSPYELPHRRSLPGGLQLRGDLPLPADQRRPGRPLDARGLLRRAHLARGRGPRGRRRPFAAAAR